MGHSKSGLFLMEMLIAILFFSIASCVSVQLFVKSKLISQESVNNNKSVIWVQNLAESYSATNGNFKLMSEMLGGLYLADTSDEENEIPKGVSLLFDKDWNLIDSSEYSNAGTRSFYYAIVSDITDTSNDLGLIEANIEVYDLLNNKVLVSQTIKKHIALRRDR